MGKQGPKWLKTESEMTQDNKDPAKARSWMLEAASGRFTGSVSYSTDFEARPTWVWTQPRHLLTVGVQVGVQV